MDVHIIIRPRSQATSRGVRKAGCIQFNRYQGSELKAIGTASIWWKHKYIYARANQSHSVITVDIPPNEFSRQFRFGFSLEILKENLPIFSGEWRENPNIANGFYLRINLEGIHQRRPDPNLPLAAVYTRHPALRPEIQEIYFE